jgi:hypothetical protein
MLKYKNALLPYNRRSKPIIPPFVGQLNPDTVRNPTHRPTTTLTSSVEARPVDPVEPKFTGENGEWETRTKQGNCDRSGFPARFGFGNGRSARSGFENGHSMLGWNWVLEWTIDSRPDLGSRRPDLWTDLGFRPDQPNPLQCAWVFGQIFGFVWMSNFLPVCVGSGQKHTHTGVGLLDLRSGRCARPRPQGCPHAVLSPLSGRPSIPSSSPTVHGSFHLDLV